MGLGLAGFGKTVSVVDTHVGGFDFIPPQPDRSIDSEPGVVWDKTAGPHHGRAYIVYTLEVQNESNNTDIFVRHSDETLLENDVVTLEPGIYLAGVGGLRIENNYRVTATGYERLSHHVIALR